jgi:hypothetical protein
MPSNPDNVVSFRSSELTCELEQRGEQLGIIAKRDLDRYYLLIADALRRVKLSQPEACLICDALNGTLNDFRLNPTHSMLFSIQDAIELEELDQKWSADKEQLLNKLSSLSTLEAAAILDAVERFWHNPEIRQLESYEEQLQLVGLQPKGKAGDVHLD